ncbi:hypothetical protein [Pedobacter cryotolerans]|uniref:Uncharacterized protein n=1 Tax=Pedobacter cryotolerans TaxID=2571270 RepID=A0A4V5NZV9_9SPHI|nr:hypothetical protein [Pedobacter cryotolerans]TKC01757.1 hypothetical protein FA045_05755 [Pedobacter cryotolerans]
MKSCFSSILIWVVMGAVVSIITLMFSNRYIVSIVPIIVVAFVYFVTKTQRTFIKKKPTPIYQLTEGLVKIEGNVSATKTFLTPHFKQECIAYTYEEGNITYDDETGSERVNTTTKKQELQDFYLSNATGKIKVIITQLNLAFLPAKTDTLHSIKYAVDDIRYTERTLKNGDLISVLGYAVKNNNYAFELTEQGNKPLVIGTPEFEDKTRKSFRVFKYLMPYLILMYIGVNYFLFAPLKIHIQESEVFPYFAIFGMPILALILGLMGNKFDGFTKTFLSFLAGTCFSVLFLTFPLICLFYMIKLEFTRIICIWITVLACTILAFAMNYKRLDGVFDKDKPV